MYLVIEKRPRSACRRWIDGLLDGPTTGGPGRYALALLSFPGYPRASGRPATSGARALRAPAPTPLGRAATGRRTSRSGNLPTSTPRGFAPRGEASRLRANPAYLRFSPLGGNRLGMPLGWFLARRRQPGSRPCSRPDTRTSRGWPARQPHAGRRRVRPGGRQQRAHPRCRGGPARPRLEDAEDPRGRAQQARRDAHGRHSPRGVLRFRARSAAPSG